MIAAPVAAQGPRPASGDRTLRFRVTPESFKNPSTRRRCDGVNRIAEKLGLKGRGSSAKAYRIEALDIIDHGTPVVVHSAVKDDDEQGAGTIDQSGSGDLMSAKGRVTSIDRVHGNIAVNTTTAGSTGCG
jgi:hypothetical protein